MGDANMPNEKSPLLASRPGVPWSTREPADYAVKVPDRVRYETGVFVNAGGLQIQTFSMGLKATPSTPSPKGIVYLCHGYASSTQYEWFQPATPGTSHNLIEGGLVCKLIDAGYEIRTLDHQGHGRSESKAKTRCYFDKFADLVDECDQHIRQE